MANVIIWSLAVATVLGTCEALTCSSLKTSCSDGSRCIPRQWICDGEEDCLDGSDEGNCERCQPVMWMCANGNQCVSEDWRCDGQSDCSDASDESSCGEDVFVLIVDYNGPIYKINTMDGTHSLVYRDSMGAENVAYDRLLKHVYWSNLQTHRIQKVRLDGQELATVQNVDRCQGLVVDPVSRLLFYTDYTTRVINMTDLQTSDTSTLIVLSEGRRPHHITADPNNQMLYWTVLGEYPGIQQLNYNGGDGRTVLTIDNGGIVTTLSLDSTGTFLYWCDESESESQVKRTHIDRGGASPIDNGPRGKLFDIDILNTTLYLIDRNEVSAYLTVSETGGNVKTNAAPQGMNQYRHIKVFTFP